MLDNLRSFLLCTSEDETITEYMRPADLAVSETPRNMHASTLRLR